MKAISCKFRAFEAVAVQVTRENITEVADWCDGNVYVETSGNYKPSEYIKVTDDNLNKVCAWYDGDVYVKAVGNYRPDDYVKLTGGAFYVKVRKNSRPDDYAKVTDNNLRKACDWYGEVYVKAVENTRPGDYVKVTGGEIYVKVRNIMETVTYIKVPTRRPINRRQTQAFVGDWIVKSEKGLKAYTAKAFAFNFELNSEDTD